MPRATSSVNLAIAWQAWLSPRESDEASATERLIDGSTSRAARKVPAVQLGLHRAHAQGSGKTPASAAIRFSIVSESTSARMSSRTPWLNAIPSSRRRCECEAPGTTSGKLCSSCSGEDLQVRRQRLRCADQPEILEKDRIDPDAGIAALGS